MKSSMPHDRMLGTLGLDRFGLCIAQYEFPHKSEPNDWDSNWLEMHGEVQHKGRQWSFQEPCLLTWEVPKVIEWMNQLPHPDGNLGFTEPHLHFAVPLEAEPWTLVLTLFDRAVPENVVNGITTGRKRARLHLNTSREQIRLFVDGLASDLRSFPQR